MGQTEHTTSACNKPMSATLHSPTLWHMVYLPVSFSISSTMHPALSSSATLRNYRWLPSLLAFTQASLLRQLHVVILRHFIGKHPRWKDAADRNMYISHECNRQDSRT
ncbi:hypothetical protein P171DRAFT_197161 [Karstenula rhodostoma CBS 690.94]|uniref:Uncharacterized protein n=1 Tax=Karstenula rhodostoma CBS 690.94 TaxID=1392251 RepID=A0A9P4PSZ4_9PLEO|nr:hypothetical protein P171DRAFT_197161 [Karstenula rhodostoma CBS 690.94]